MIFGKEKEKEKEKEVQEHKEDDKHEKSKMVIEKDSAEVFVLRNVAKQSH